MARNKVTQKEAIFYQLYKHWQSNKGEYIPVFKLMGEVHVAELGLWGFVSHEVSPRCSELRQENPELIQITEITGKSGARYYGHRINPDAKLAMIKEPRLQNFYQRIKEKGA